MSLGQLGKIFGSQFPDRLSQRSDHVEPVSLLGLIKFCGEPVKVLIGVCILHRAIVPRPRPIGKGPEAEKKPELTFDKINFDLTFSEDQQNGQRSLATSEICAFCGRALGAGPAAAVQILALGGADHGHLGFDLFWRDQTAVKDLQREADDATFMLLKWPT